MLPKIIVLQEFNFNLQHFKVTKLYTYLQYQTELKQIHPWCLQTSEIEKQNIAMKWQILQHRHHLPKQLCLMS